MAVTAKSVMQRVIDVLQDPTFKRWTAVELVRWLNEGQRFIATVQPDATAAEVELTLAEGSEQSIGSSAAKLLDVRRNVNGPAVTLADRTVLNAVKPNWQVGTAAQYVQHFIHDPRDPRAFSVFPPALGSSATKVLALVSNVPTDIAAPASNDIDAVLGNISLADRLDAPLVDFILYRAFSKDAVQGSSPRAMAHYTAFAQALGLDTRGTVLMGPTSSSAFNKPAYPARSSAA
jgi:hypothetical protein